jgi:hypothetical protein
MDGSSTDALKSRSQGPGKRSGQGSRENFHHFRLRKGANRLELPDLIRHVLYEPTTHTAQRMPRGKNHTRYRHVQSARWWFSL